MPICEPCTYPLPDTSTTEVGAHRCVDRDRATIFRTCTCRCGRPEKDPAPYWSQHAQQLDGQAEAGDDAGGGAGRHAAPLETDAGQ